MGRRNKKLLRPLNLLLISCIIAFSFLGIGYAYWNDSLEIFAKIKMAEFKPMFCSQYSFKDTPPKAEELRNLEVNIKDGKKDENQIIYIDGSVIKGYQGSFHFCIKNNGSIPIAIDEKDKEEKFTTENGIGLILSNQFKDLEPGERIYHPKGNPQLYIDAKHADDNPDLSGAFKFELRFRPVTGGSWEKKLIIMGNILVESESEDSSNEKNLKSKSVITNEVLNSEVQETIKPSIDITDDKNIQGNSMGEIEPNSIPESSSDNSTNVDETPNIINDTIEENNADSSGSDVNSDSDTSDIDITNDSSDNDTTNESNSDSSSTVTGNDSVNNSNEDSSGNDSGSSDTSNSDSGGGEGESNEE